MKKWFEKWVLVIIWVIIICCVCINLNTIIKLEKLKSLPQIKLPRAMQHNTIGELPIVEMADDGDFYEKDGAEETGRAKRLSEYKLKLESEYRSCLDKITKKCGKGSNDKYIYKYYSHLPMAVWEKNPDFKYCPKEDACRIKKADRCYDTLEEKAKAAAYHFYSMTGYFYFKAHGDLSDEQWFSDEGGYMETFTWYEKENK